MELTTFIQDLITKGKVYVKGIPIPFTEEDTQQATILLEEIYRGDIPEMPYTAPDFSAPAALWAARYFYQAVQLTVSRDSTEEMIEEQLQKFTGETTPATIYSVDLVFRQLPALFELAKGLAPADMLVSKLREISVQWPFSSVGIDLAESVNDDIIFSHPSLRQTYIDRIIAHKDRNRINSSEALTYLFETTGEHLSIIWPGFETELKPITP